MYYLVVNGVKLPQPYLTYVQAMAALEAMREQMGACFIDLVYE